MRSLSDDVIELLEDGKWHTIMDISRKTKRHRCKIEALMDFLSKYSLLQLSEKEQKARLSETFLKFLSETSNS